MRFTAFILFLAAGLAATSAIILLAICVMPVVGLIALPGLAIAIILHIYAIVLAVHSQYSLENSLSIAFAPIRAIRVYIAILQILKSSFSLIPYGIDHIFRSIALLNPRLKRRIMRDNIIYRSHPKKYLDVYFPSPLKSRNSSISKDSSTNNSSLRPVIVFIHGGNWFHGSKRMYLQVGLRLRRMGYVVVIPEYSLFPNGHVQDMISDIKRALFWTKKNILQYGGDKERIYLMGHSAGAHLSALTLIQDSVLKSSKPLSNFSNSTESFDSISSKNYQFPPPFPTPYDPSTPLVHIEGLILLAGVYNVPSHYIFESKRGLEKLSPMRRVMGGDQASLSLNSPFLLLSHPTLTLLSRSDINVNDRLASSLPPKILLIHGAQDAVVPLEQSIQFWRKLRDLGIGLNQNNSSKKSLKNIFDPDTKEDIDGLRIRCFRNMNHLDPILGLLYTRQKSKYSNILAAEINDFINS